MDIIGHRGCKAHFPENTVAAIRGCAPHVDMVEVDIRRCRSGEIVVFHDDELDELTDGSGPVCDHSYEELSSLRVEGSDETIPLLSDVLDTLPEGTGINIELKHAGMHNDVAPLIRETGHEVLVSSFDTSAIEPFRREPVPTALLFIENFVSNLDTATALGCEYVHPLYRIADAESIARAHERGFSVNAWTVPTKAAVHRLRDGGVDGVIVDSWTIIPE